MKLVYLFMSALLSTSLSMNRTKAGDDAAVFDTLLLEAKSGFQKIDGPEALIETAPFLQSADNYKLALQLVGDKQRVCFWQFDYRSEKAKAQFEKLNAMLDDAINSDQEKLEDIDVNHPDFYDLKAFKNSGATLAVSLKDKAALEQTHGFLRASKTETLQ